jgi:hypothetical protein
MPKIKSTTRGFEGRLIKVEVHCKGGEFSCSLPLTVADALGYKTVKAMTLAKCESKWERAVREYEESRTTSSKVIYYDLNISGKICQEDPHLVLLDRDEISFSTGLVLGLRASVYTETVRTLAGGRKQFEYRELPRREHTIPHSLVNHGKFTGFGPGGHTVDDSRPPGVIDWSPEREAFFTRIGRSLEQMILSADNVFKDESKLLAVADRGAAGNFMANGRTPRSTR